MVVHRFPHGVPEIHEQLRNSINWRPLREPPLKNLKALEADRQVNSPGAVQHMHIDFGEISVEVRNDEVPPTLALVPPLASPTSLVGAFKPAFSKRIRFESAKRQTTLSSQSSEPRDQRCDLHVPQGPRKGSEKNALTTGEYTAPRGDLVITAPIVFGRLHVLPVITEFLLAYPEVNVRLLLGDRTVNLLEDHIDLALRIGELPDSSLNALRLGKVRRVVCGSPEYLAEHGLPRAPEELGAHQCIGFDTLTSSGAWPFLIKEREVSVPIRPRLIVSTAEAAIEAARSGFGLTRVLSYQIAETEETKQLQTVLADFELTSRSCAPGLQSPGGDCR